MIIMSSGVASGEARRLMEETRTIGEACAAGGCHPHVEGSVGLTSPGIGHPMVRPTTPGQSPGIGHPMVRPTTPGQSPGIGHPSNTR
ncbi:hypothetical protein HU200_001127 [Digitaria exilis]|uniref:Uncharacterized protein n=1 Tax=Digitaria exilis TaxID=1010633 RepID=A0A835KVD5_9POAL|nr:hypothetical protein HU200_001127 [Digitaria exilis]